MGEFRIGRKHATHSYPDPRRDTTLNFARNSAIGPALTTAVATAPGTTIPWDVIESGAPSGINIPITPRVTGRVKVVGQVTVKVAASSLLAVQVTVGRGGGPLVTQNFPVTQDAYASDDVGGSHTVPIDALISPALPVGVVSNVSLQVTASVGGGALTLAMDSCTLDVQEVPFATG